MAKSNQHKNWLNVVIITVSGLILAFTLLGRFFNSGEPAESITSQPRVEQFELVGLDFGQLQLNKSGTKWLAIPDTEISQKQLQQLVNQWNLLLGKDIQTPEVDDTLKIQSATTVLLYLRGEPRPIICKVIVEGEKAYVEFLASGQKVAITPNLAKELLPSEVSIPKLPNKKPHSTKEQSDA